MFEGVCRSFIVFFPTEKVLLEKETEKILSQYCPLCKELACDLHFTICYFSADYETCKKIADEIDSMAQMPAPVEMALDAVKFSYIEAIDKSLFWWDIPKNPEIVSLRSVFLEILKKHDAEIDHEDTWDPHMNICSIPGKTNECALISEFLKEPVKVSFQFLQLSRMLPDNEEDDTFEIVRSWKLSKSN